MKVLSPHSRQLERVNVRHQRPVIYRCFLLLLAIGLLTAALPAHAQFGWDDEPVTDTDLDQFDAALRTPAIEPLESAYFSTFDPPLVTPPPVVVPWPSSPLVRAEEALVEQCDLEPEVAQVYRASGIDDSTRDPLPATSYGRDAACPTYLGRLSANPYDPDSVANPYGRYGSPNTGALSARDRSRMRDPQGDMSASEGVNSSTSVNNPYSTYGSPYSSQSPNNPYATQAPLLFGD